MAATVVPGQFDDADVLWKDSNVILNVNNGEIGASPVSQHQSTSTKEDDGDVYEDDSPEDSEEEDDWNWDEETSDFTKKYNAARYATYSNAHRS